jgi:ribonuclease HI
MPMTTAPTCSNTQARLLRRQARRRARRDADMASSLAALSATCLRQSDTGMPLSLCFGAKSGTYAVAQCDAGAYRKRCTLGGVIRERRKLIGMVMEPCPHTGNVIEAELYAIARVMEEALALGVRSLEVRTDCQSTLVHVLDAERQMFPQVVARIRALLPRFRFLVLVNVPREDNREADALARSARSQWARARNAAPALEPVSGTPRWENWLARVLTPFAVPGWSAEEQPCAA